MALSPLVDVSSMQFSRDCLMMGMATGVLGLTFGVSADAAGFDLPRIVAMSALVFNGPAQFAAVGVIGDGGTGAGAIGSGMLMAARNALYGPVVRRLVPTGTPARLRAAYFVLDSNTAMALAQPERRDAAGVFWFMGVTLWLFWNSGSVVGALLGSFMGAQETWGIDAAFPAISVGLLAPHVRNAAGQTAALAATAVAVGAVPISAPGIPVLLALVALAPALCVRSLGRSPLSPGATSEGESRA